MSLSFQLMKNARLEHDKHELISKVNYLTEENERLRAENKRLERALKASEERTEYWRQAEAAHMATILSLKNDLRVFEVLSEEVKRGLILIKGHFDDDGHNWTEGTEMEDVEAAFEWIALLARFIAAGKP